MATAQWAFEHVRKAGQGTDVSADFREVFITISYGVKSLAVLVIELAPKQSLPSGRLRDLEAFASITALAITRVRLANEAEQAKWFLESEKLLYKALLNTVSHDLSRARSRP